jgi:hypothetical protein
METFFAKKTKPRKPRDRVAVALDQTASADRMKIVEREIKFDRNDVESVQADTRSTICDI